MIPWWVSSVAVWTLGNKQHNRQSSCDTGNWSTRGRMHRVKNYLWSVWEKYWIWFEVRGKLALKTTKEFLSEQLGSRHCQNKKKKKKIKTKKIFHFRHSVHLSVLEAFFHMQHTPIHPMLLSSPFYYICDKGQRSNLNEVTQLSLYQRAF